MTRPAVPHWYWIAPPLRERLAARVSHDRVKVGAHALAFDGGALVAAGAALGIVNDRGTLVVTTTLDALIAVGASDALGTWAAAGPSPDVLKLVGPGHPAFVYLLFRAFGDSPRVREALSVADSLANQLADARGWALLIGDRAQAQKTLDAAVARCRSVGDYLAAAEAAAAIAVDVKPLLQQAEGLASTLTERLTVIVEGLRLHGDEAAASAAIDGLLAGARDSSSLRAVTAAARGYFDDAYVTALIEEAEGRATGAGDLAACAQIRLSIFGDEAAARRDLGQAIERNGWRYVAPVWKNGFSDEAAARATLDEAEQKADPATLADAAGTWITLFDDKERAKAALRTAESRATGTADWAACAAAWNRTFADVAEVKRCLGEMEKRAASSADWNECAQYWIEVLKDNGEAARCLGRAEEAAKSTGDLVACVRVRRQIDPNPAEAARVLAIAEERAKEIGDLVNCATEWNDIAKDAGRAKAVLAKAAEMAWAVTHFVAIAIAWGKSLGDKDTARKLLVAGEKKAVEPGDFGVLGRGYREQLADEDEAKRCLVREMELNAGDDLVACARGWKRILGEGEPALAKLREREASAQGAAAWQAIGKAWREGFGSEADGERADLWATRWVTVEKALSAGDWTAYAQSWKEILSDDDAAKKRLRDAEENARTLTDWAAFGLAWHRVFEDRAETSRCIKEAEAKTRFKSDWKVVAEAWRQIGDYAEAQRCLDHR